MSKSNIWGYLSNIKCVFFLLGQKYLLIRHTYKWKKLNGWCLIFSTIFGHLIDKKEINIFLIILITMLQNQKLVESIKKRFWGTFIVFQSSNIFFSFYEFSQMLVNLFLKILFLDETRFYTSNAWCFQLCCSFHSHQDDQGQRLAILPFLDFNTIKWAWWIQPSSVFITLQWNNQKL